MASSSSSPRNETPESRAKEIVISSDPAPLINLLLHLFSGDESRRSDAKSLYDFCKRDYPNSLSLKLANLLRKSPLPTTRTRCSILLRRILTRADSHAWPHLSHMSRNDLKVVFLDCLQTESDPEASKNLCNLVSDIAADLLPQGEWPELFSFMLQSLESNLVHVRVNALQLFGNLSPTIGEMLSPHVDRLSGACLDSLKAAFGFMSVSVAAVGASVNLVLYLATPSSHKKYQELLAYMSYTLFATVTEKEDGYAQKVIEDLIVLAGAETGFLTLQISDWVDVMLNIAENKELEEKTRQLGIEFVITVAEDRERGCGMIQKLSGMLTRLLGLLMEMLVFIEDDDKWYKADSDDQSAGESGMCLYAMESLSRLAIALRGNAIVKNYPGVMASFLADSDWRKRHAAVTALGLISEGCSKAMVQNLRVLVEMVLSLSHDPHLRVRWAAIHCIGRFSKYLSPQLQEQCHQQLLPALIDAIDNFENPRVQAQAASAMLLFSRNCTSSILKPYLNGIVRKLLEFLQKGECMLKEGALTALASLANSAKEDFREYYDTVMPYLNVILCTETDESDSTLLAKSMECITMIGMAVGKEKFSNDAEEVVKVLISLQEFPMETDDPMRNHVLQAWGRLCKCLGQEFLPYLSVSMPQLLQSAQLQNHLIVSTNPDGIDDLDCGRFGLRTNVLEEKLLACNILCCFAAELKGKLHLWIDEVANALIPLLKFKFHEEVKATAISGMPLILRSAASAMKKGLPLRGFNESAVKKLSDRIIPALLKALHEDSKTEIRAMTLDSLNQCLQISGSHLNKSQLTQFVDGISEVLTACSYKKTERKKRVKAEDLDAGQHELIKEETEQEEKVYKMIGDCLGTLIKTFKTSFLPFLEKLLPFIALMWGNDKTAEERRIALRIFHDVAEQCQEEAFRYYERCLPFLLKACNDENPEVRQVVARGIGICAEFGRPVFQAHVGAALSNLKSVIEHPDALHPNNVMAYEAAVSAYGKICHLHCDGINTFEVASLWLHHLPIRNDIDEAKLVHDVLCSMIETTENKLAGPAGVNIPKIFAVLSEVLWGASCLATEQTVSRMIKILKQFQLKLPPSTFAAICASLPLPQRNMLQSIFSS